MGQSRVKASRVAMFNSELNNEYTVRSDNNKDAVVPSSPHIYFPRSDCLGNILPCYHSYVI
jgi:hypothetical protein